MRVKVKVKVRVRVRVRTGTTSLELVVGVRLQLVLTMQLGDAHRSLGLILVDGNILVEAQPRLQIGGGAISALEIDLVPARVLEIALGPSELDGVRLVDLHAEGRQQLGRGRLPARKQREALEVALDARPCSC